jgi:hypothetical protein
VPWRESQVVHEHCRETLTAWAAESEAHLTRRVPPWFWALHVPEHVTEHVAPAAHVTLEPAPTATVQLLPDSHVTLADAPAPRSQVV